MLKISKKFTIFLLTVLLLLSSCAHQPTPEETAIKLGSEWFLNNQNEDFLYYEYNLTEKTHPDSQHSLREMGALWSITQLANFLNDENYTHLAQKGFAYFEKYFKYNEEHDFYYINITPDKVKLGYSAFAILTLIEIDHPKKDEYLTKLANGILYLQNERGDFDTFFFSNRTTGKDYYPGEALLALMSLYEYNGDQRYLDAVRKAFPRYVNYFRANANTAFVPWQTRAYAKLYNKTNDRIVSRFIFEMNDYMLEEHNPIQECSDFQFSGITVAVYMEGVIKAYEIAKIENDTTRSECYLNFITEATRHIISLQITESTEKEAIGGFTANPTSDTQRVDRNQHAVMALMDAFKLK